jgi:Ca2+-binding RTX toxin-like protein
MLSFIKRLLGPTRRPAAHKAGFRPTLEALEDRLVLSTLVLRGDQGGTVHNDKFVLSTRVGSIDQIVYYADGRQVVAFDIPSGTAVLDIDGKSGTDTVVVGNLSHSYDVRVTNPEYLTVDTSALASNVTISTTSGGPSTAVTLNGASGSVGRNLTIAPTYFAFATITDDGVAPQESAEISFRNAHIGSVVIYAGSGNDVVRVWNTPAPTTVNMGGGNDYVYFGRWDSIYTVGDLAGLTGTLSVDGGSGQDQLFVSDGSSTLANSSYTVSSTSFTRGAKIINYGGFEGANFEAGGTGSTVNVKSTAAGVPTVVATSSALGVKVGNDAGRLDEILGSLSVSAVNTSGTAIPGGALTLDDHLSTRAHSYTITRNGSVQVAREDGISITSSAMSSVSLKAGTANDTVTVVDTNSQAIPTPVSVDGGGGSGDKLIQQPTWSNGFVINGLNQGTAFGVAFSGVENLVGGSADDTFAFQTGGSLSGTIDGGGGIYTLDYSALTTGVTVDLAARIAAGVFNNAAGGIANIRNVTGSKGNDLLRGDASANVLLGVDGNDILIGLDDNDYLDACGIDGVGLGATRRNILIAGRGADTLLGSEGEDILIGGSFENNLDSNDAVLRAFMDVWKGTGDYYSRAYALNQNGVAVNGVTYKVNDNNIQRDDGATDVFYGYGGKHWYWVGGDDVDDRIAGVEYKNDLTL